ncbi:MAG: hypothetical protein H7Y06_02795 [Opitutaceae bacterium]|nr:hypothetical protein [Opitutaceae bacterium]
MAFSIEEIRRQMIEEKARLAEARAQSGATASPAFSGPITGDTLIGVRPTSARSPASPVHTAAPVSPTVEATRATTPPFVAAPVVPVVEGSSPLHSASSLARFFKVCIAAVIVMASCYFGVKSAYPFLKELSHPGSTATSKDSPASVKLLQQTRGVVAKNNANVDNLNALIEESVGGNYAASNTLAMPALPTPPPQAKPKPSQPQVRLERLAGVILDDLHVSSVLGGRNPQITINGLIVSLGDVADAKRRLRFESLDEKRRVIVLGNGQETIEKPY